MKKVAFCNAQYNASLPPYRFDPGDVVEIDDDWADQLVQRGIATPAKKNAKTVQQIRLAARPPVPTAADNRSSRRAQLQAEMDALNAEDAATVEQDDDDEEDEAPSKKPSEGHYSDMVTRGEPGEPAEDPVTSGGHAKASGRK